MPRVESNGTEQSSPGPFFHNNFNVAQAVAKLARQPVQHESNFFSDFVFVQR